MKLLALGLLLWAALGAVVGFQEQREQDHFSREDRDYRPLQFGKRSDFRPLQFGKKDNYRPLQFGKRAPPAPPAWVWAPLD